MKTIVLLVVAHLLALWILVELLGALPAVILVVGTDIAAAIRWRAKSG